MSNKSIGQKKKKKQKSDEKAKEKKGAFEKENIKFKEFLDILISYSEKHYGRVERLLKKSFLLDYLLASQELAEVGTAKTEAWEDKPLKKKKK